MQHEWVENFKEYEAVLVCLNELPHWEPEQVARAFATYQWFDATTSGDDPSFRHNDTGTIVRHEGNVLAIDFGDGHTLLEELPDLFYTLHSLGWRIAEVYHPAETISVLLEDMGRAIPASLDFDVRPAQPAKALIESPAAQMLMAAAAEKLDHTAFPTPGADSVILDTFRDLGNTTESPTVFTGAGHTGAVHLVDDVVADEEPIVFVAEHLASTPLVPPSIALAYDPSLDTSIIVPDIGGDSTDAISVALDQRQEEKVITTDVPLAEPDSAPIPEMIDATSTTHYEGAMTAYPTEAVPVEVSHEEVKTVQIISIPEPIMAEQGSISVETINDISDTTTNDLGTSTLQKTIKVGQCVFCFDVPSSGLLTAQEIQSLAGDCRISPENVIHIQPGALNEPLRWDFLGEIDDAYPWITENLVASIVPNADRLLASCIFMAVRKENPYAGLRDVAMFAGYDQETMAKLLGAVTPAALMLFNQHLPRGGFDKTIDALVHQLGALALAPAGTSFVDLQVGHEESPDSIPVAFTVREMMFSNTPKAIVLHVSALDGAFIEGIVESLRAVAQMYATAKRFNTADAPTIPEVIEEPAAPVPIVPTEVLTMLTELTTRLKSFDNPTAS